jgi:hypothetical protein
MVKSVRIGQKVKRLTTLAERIIGANELDNFVNDLLDTNSLADDFVVGASCLNNDGVPLQLSLTSAPNGVSMRLIGDPGAYHQNTENRYHSSIQTLNHFIDQSLSKDLKFVAQKTVNLLIPQSAKERLVYKQGFTWIGVNPLQPGIAFYLEMAPLGYEKGWLAVENWLKDILPDSTIACVVLNKLKKHCIIASAGLEGSTIENTRAKLYFRFKESSSLDKLDIDLFETQEMREFLKVSMASFDVDLQGFVMNIGFNLLTGKIADVKVDLCGHCLRHSAEQWTNVINQLTDRFLLSSVDTFPILNSQAFEIAFIGFGLTTELKPRLNIYLKHGILTETPETDEIWSSVKDAMYYLKSVQNKDGSWDDYNLPVGKSDQWVTAYAAHALAQYGNRSGNLDALEAATLAADWLKQFQTYNMGWGYNRITGPDADSTAIAIALFDELGMDVDENDRLFLKKQWRNGECMATYEGPLAWGNGHWDVTPWGYYGMLPEDRELYYQEFCNALNVQYMNNGFWRSYWWRNPFYSTFITLEVLEKLGLQGPSNTLRSIESAFNIDNAFDLGCYIGIECIRNHSNEKLGSYLRNLLNWQLKNGSWEGSPNLRVTENYCYTPWDEPKGVYYKDEKSVITTATIIRVLSKIISTKKSESKEVLYHWV